MNLNVWTWIVGALAALMLLLAILLKIYALLAFVIAAIVVMIAMESFFLRRAQRE